MTVRNLYELYKQGLGVERAIVLCDHKNGDGYKINSMEEFDTVIELMEDHDLFLLNKQESKEFVYFEYFKMEKTAPCVAIVRHPYLTNAYWKDKPDHIIDIVNIEGYVYRYLSVDYGFLLKENIIELPTTVADPVFNLLKKRFSGAFYNNVKETNASYSLVFTNTDRFGDEDQLAYRTFPLDEVYSDLKKPTIKSVSQKFFKELKALAE